MHSVRAPVKREDGASGKQPSHRSKKGVPGVLLLGWDPGNLPIILDSLNQALKIL